MPTAGQYEIGAFVGIDGVSNFLYQSSSPKHTSTKVTAADYIGNTSAIKFHDDIVSISIDAVIPLASGVPQAGQIVKLTGIKLPTYGGASTTWSITGNVSDTAYFYCENPSIKSVNKEFQTVTIECTHHLANNHPANSTDYGITT